MRHGRWELGGAVALVLCAAVASGCGASAPASDTKAPKAPPHAARSNIVFVLTDDLSRDLVRFMPHVRALRRAGTHFSRYVVSDSLCCPSRSSIFTGKLPHDTGVFTNLPPDGGYGAFTSHGNEASTFATALQRRGYRTAMMGKYLNGYDVHGPVPAGWTEWDATDAGYREYGYTLNQNGTLVPHGHAPGDYLTDVVAARGKAFIDASAQAGKPFMLEIASFAPHSPSTPAPRDVGTFPNAHKARGPAFDAANRHAPSWLAGRPPLTARQQAVIDRKFRRRVRSVQAVDDMLAGLQQRLRANGVARDTYVVFSSDNGFHLGQHRLLAGKQTAFDHDVVVPLIVTGPGVPPGRDVGALTQNTDLAPTFQALGHAPVGRDVDGRSLVGLLHGGRVPRDWRDAALVEHHGPDVSPGDPDKQGAQAGNPTTYEALRLRHATYVEYRNGEREYYDLRRDPFELRNAYGSLGTRERGRLHRRLAALEGCHGSGCSDRAR